MERKEKGILVLPSGKEFTCNMVGYNRKEYPVKGRVEMSKVMVGTSLNKFYDLPANQQPLGIIVEGYETLYINPDPKVLEALRAGVSAQTEVAKNREGVFDIETTINVLLVEMYKYNDKKKTVECAFRHKFSTTPMETARAISADAKVFITSISPHQKSGNDISINFEYEIECGEDKRQGTGSIFLLSKELWLDTRFQCEKDIVLPVVNQFIRPQLKYQFEPLFKKISAILEAKFVGMLIPMNLENIEAIGKIYGTTLKDTILDAIVSGNTAILETMLVKIKPINFEHGKKTRERRSGIRKITAQGKNWTDSNLGLSIREAEKTHQTNRQ